jgi:hypothetical protein
MKILTKFLAWLRLKCEVCRRPYFAMPYLTPAGCECGYTIAAVIAAVIAAAGTATTMVMQSEAAQQQAKAQGKAAQMQADAETQAGASRAALIQYNADKQRRSFLSREAGAGVQVGQGSLLETETQFSYDTQLSKDLAKYPHELAGASDKYQSDLFGFQRRQMAGQEVAGAAIGGTTAAASSLAASYRAGAFGSSSSGSSGGAIYSDYSNMA